MLSLTFCRGFIHYGPWDSSHIKNPAGDRLGSDCAMNKYIIVPRLLPQTDTAQFQRSVRIEIVVAILLLLLTAYLSTALGPTMH